VPFTEDECALILRSLLEAVDYMHSKGIVHRDIKPANVLMRDMKDLSSLVLADFGFAIFLGELESSHGNVGTILYQPPEQSEKQRYGKVRTLC